ncbi:MAG: hypothetical protein ACP5E3_10850 [Bacteroidales bacterium]
MKKILFIALMGLISCQTGTSDKIPPGRWLEYYRAQTERTDPGQYEYLYENLPKSLDSLCLIIKSQLIHPYLALQMGIKVDDYSEDESFPNVESMLEALVLSDSTGITLNRERGDRLVVASYHHAILLASILRSQGVPVRMRAGFSRYYDSNYQVRFGHTVCEVWDRDENQWLLVIPELEQVGLNNRVFDYSWEAWRNIRERKMDPRRYTSPMADGLKAIVNFLVLDAYLVLQDEKLYWDLPKIVMEDPEKISDLTQKQINTLNQLAERLANYHSNPDKIGDILYNQEFFRSARISYDDYMDLVREKN